MGFKNACTALYLVKNYLLRAIAVYHIQELASYKTRANKKADTNYKNLEPVKQNWKEVTTNVFSIVSMGLYFGI